MKSLTGRYSLVALLILMLTLPAAARLKNLNLPLRLDAAGPQQLQLQWEGLYCPMASDTLMLSSGFSFSYGINRHLVFSADLPWQQHSYNGAVKMGQGDALIGLLLHRAGWFGLDLHLGWKTSLRLASGYREEFDGFPSYTAGRNGLENLLVGAWRQHRLTLNGWAGYFSDQAWENQRTVWGLSMWYELWRDRLRFFGELGHELILADKTTQQQLFVGVEVPIGWGFGLNLGMEQKLIADHDYPGFFLTLNYARQPRLLHSIEQQRLQPEMRDLLQEKEQAIADSLAAPPARHGDGTLRLALLPFSGKCGVDLADRVREECRLTFGIDGNLELIPSTAVTAALRELDLPDHAPLTREELAQAGELLAADFVLTGEVNRCEHRTRNGAGIPWLFQTRRQQFSLDAQLLLIDCTSGRVTHNLPLLVSRERPLAPLLFSSPRRNSIPLSSPVAADLQRETIAGWSRQALERLFYETEVQWLAEESQR